ncbi:signal peptidase I [Bacillus suaedaesalsae]|uniref:Signal peptidase I n=1 Tax=Bacillus suaedaesalsae TaxID=2810349 RepID=A0ABS2DJZ5_9BACI|nr:signal peptidase I [Bacillus suaedaesalsae]MBM6618819.1 signal peptidase I [Bacillus suaedaesalsae]
MKGFNEVWEWIKPLSIAIILVIIIRNFIFAPIVVDGDSMMPTLHDRERMVVSKIGEPERFDIVVFHATEEKDYIKRVIGLPGDRIEYKDDVLYINGKAQEEPYLQTYKEQLQETAFEGQLTEDFSLMEIIGQDTVPEGTLFVMGDNRSNSIDSRNPSLGVVPMEEMIGKTNLVYWPLNDIKVVE